MPLKRVAVYLSLYIIKHTYHYKLRYEFVVVWFSVVRYDGHGHVLLHQGGQRPVPRLLPQRRRHLPLHHVRRRLLEGGCDLHYGLNIPSLGVRALADM